MAEQEPDGRDVKTIGKHINNALKEELDNSTVANFATVQNEGGRDVERNIEYYNLDMIISVGYRVKSQRGIEFRRWANKVLKDYIIRGYAINDKRLEALQKPEGNQPIYRITYADCRAMVDRMEDSFKSDVFGVEKEPGIRLSVTAPL